MNIPSHFYLGGIRIDVVEENLVETENCIGKACYSKQQIAIDTKAAPREITEQSFLHEVIHWCFYIMGEDDLRNNEKIVDILAHLLYQYTESQVLNEKKKNIR